MNSSLSKRAINRQRWLERVQGWQQSGLSQKEFCEQHQLRVTSFQRWRRIFMTEESSKEEAPITFLPVNVMEPSSSSLIVRVNENLHIEILPGFDPLTLKQVIQVLQAA